MKSDVITVIQSCQRWETGSSGIIYKEQDFVCILEKIGVKLLQKNKYCLFPNLGIKSKNVWCKVAPSTIIAS